MQEQSFEIHWTFNNGSHQVTVIDRPQPPPPSFPSVSFPSEILLHIIQFITNHDFCVSVSNLMQARWSLKELIASEMPFIMDNRCISVNWAEFEGTVRDHPIIFRKVEVPASFSVRVTNNVKLLESRGFCIISKGISFKNFSVDCPSECQI